MRVGTCRVFFILFESVEKNDKTLKNGHFLSGESQKPQLSEKSFRVLPLWVKRLCLVRVTAKIKKKSVHPIAQLCANLCVYAYFTFFFESVTTRA